MCLLWPLWFLVPLLLSYFFVSLLSGYLFVTILQASKCGCCAQLATCYVCDSFTSMWPSLIEFTSLHLSLINIAVDAVKLSKDSLNWTTQTNFKYEALASAYVLHPLATQSASISRICRLAGIYSRDERQNSGEKLSWFSNWGKIYKNTITIY